MEKSTGALSEDRGLGDRAQIQLATLERLLALPSTRLPETLEAGAQLIGELFGAEKVDAWVHAPEAGELVVAGISDTPLSRKEVALRLDRLRLDQGGPIVEVFRTGRPFLISGAEPLGFPPDIDHKLGVQSMMGQPLVVGDERRGVLLVCSTRPERYTEDDLRFLGTVSHWIGLAAHRAELAEQAARHAAEERARVILAAAGEGIYGVDYQGRATFLNPAAARMLGYRPEELTGRVVHELIHHTRPDGSPYPRDDCPIYQALRDGSVHQRAEEVFWRKDGSSFPVEYISTPVREEGRIVGAVCTFDDITDRRRAEEERARLVAALRESEQRYREIFERAAVSLWEEDFSSVKALIDELKAQGVGDLGAYLDEHPEVLREAIGRVRILDVNQQTLQLFDARNKEELLASLERTFVPESARVFRDELVAMAEGQCSLATEAPVRTLRGERRDALLTITVPEAEAGFDRVLVSMMDITARRRAEQEREQLLAREQATREQLAFLAEAGQLLASSLDYEATLSAVARLAVPRLADWCAVDLAQPDGQLRRLAVAHQDPAKVELAHEVARRYPPDPDAPRGIFRVLHTGKPELYPEIPDALLVQVARDAEHLAALRALDFRSAMVVPLLARERSLGAITFVAAQSGRRYSAADLALAEELARVCALAIDNARLHRDVREAVRARDQFLSVSSHELRNPLAGLKATAQTVERARERGALDEERLERSLNSIKSGVDRLVRLTDDLLDVARLRTGRLEVRPRPLDLAGFVREVVDRSRAHLTDRHTLELDVRDGCALTADPDRLEQVLTNLLTNAAKYAPEGGLIRVAARPDGAGALLEVCDQGIGLPAGATEAIFEPFGRAENAAARQIPGLGLGLHICRQIVELHGGRIWAESPGEGRGTTMRVWLPCRNAPW